MRQRLCEKASRETMGKNFFGGDNAKKGLMENMRKIFFMAFVRKLFGRGVVGKYEKNFFWETDFATSNYLFFLVFSQKCNGD